jgi:AAA+ ATPase superfamily predicted ATPase
MNDDIFPQGLATGQNFCNRVDEQAHLINNIQTLRPTLIMSPRRYGKTSLVMQVTHKLNIPFAGIDLFSELDETEVQNSILTGVARLVHAVESTTQKAVQFVSEFFSDLNVSFRYQGAAVEIELNKSIKSPAKTILAALEKLDALLVKKKQKAVLFFDEFQRVAEISTTGTIEGAIRHIAQQSKAISFIFSGSNRRLLESMFYDSKKPLYKLCDRMSLARISQDDYRPFIQKLAKTKWHTALDEAVLDAVFYYSERHSYYVNVLCHKLWLKKEAPTEADVLLTWQKYALEEKSNILSEMDLLSKNQSKMLIAIAKYGHENQPTSKSFLSTTHFSATSASQALEVLVKKDYIYMDDEGCYRLVDPLMKFLFSQLK